ncbi:MAG: SDR family oxidoreductase [Litoreibacter sp.]|nr:SDR family oxidoreductase [Litoreibacter sp.]
MKALITGANRGIGRAMHDQMKARGDDVIGTARRPAEGDAGFVTLDVTNTDSIEALKAQLQGHALDLLVCNSGVYLDKGDALETGYSEQAWADSFAVNVTGVFLTIRALLPNLRKSSAGKIAIISSHMASSERAPGGAYIYRASKAAVLNLGRNLAVDLTPENIAVGIYHPGWVQTDMGGAAADITVEQSAAGLLERFDTLSMPTTGVFETYDGVALPF